MVYTKNNERGVNMEHNITYGMKGVSRKELSKAISEVLNTASVYKGVPSCAYEIGDLILDRGGSIILGDTMTPVEVDSLVKKLEEKGFTATNYREVYEVAMPRDMFTDKALDNLRKIVNAKGELIGKAIGNVDLRIIERDEEVSFPWYPKTEDAEEVKYYLQFTESLCKMAIERTRVTSVPKISKNEKYDFRCFLVRLGFIGEEFKGFRKFMMRNLTGNAAFKKGKKE